MVDKAIKDMKSEAIKDMKSEKAPGPSSITAKMIEIFGSVNQFIHENVVPSD